MVKVWNDSEVNYEEIFSVESLHQAQVVQTLDSAIHRIKIYPVNSDLSGG